MALDRVTAMMPNSALGGAKSSARLHQRELTFALMHMMDMARALLEHKQHEDRGL